LCVGLLSAMDTYARFCTAFFFSEYYRSIWLL